MTATTAVMPRPGVRWPFRVGNTLVHPVFDYLVIGGGLSVLVTAYLAWGRRFSPEAAAGALGAYQLHLPLVVLIVNSAHFAASTVRLYTKPRAREEHRFLTAGLPLVTLLALFLAVLLAAPLGRHVFALYMTWSPFHYSAQAYGLAMLYCYRSGASPTDDDRRLLRTACLVPFLRAFLDSPGAGVEWFAPAWMLDLPAATVLRQGFVAVLSALTFAVPVIWIAGLVRRQAPRVPFISLLVVLSNGLWFVVLRYIDAFAVATVFHGLQYLAVVTVFHVKDHPRGGWLAQTAGFYAACLGLGYLLFNAWPYAFVGMGFGLAESMLLVVAAINIHHFIVDAYIWRLRKGSNARIAAAPILEAS